MQPLLIAVTSSAAAADPDVSVEDDLEAVARRLTGELGLSPDGRGEVERVLLDSFDWRLYRHGWMLEHERRLPDGAAVLRLRPLDAAGVLEAPVVALPVHPDEVPDTPLRDKLNDLVGVRALLPLAAVATRWARFRHLDAQSKTVGRVTVSEDTVPDKGPYLGLTVQVAPVRGYPTEFERLAAALVQALGCERGTDALLRAAAAAGRPPGQDPSAFDVELPVDVSAGDGFRMLLRRVMDVIKANEQGVRDDLDDEFLHDFRVAIRRGRAIAHVSRGLLGRSEQQWLEEELGWLGRITGPCRDLDVLLADLSAEHSELTSKRADFAPLLGRLERRRQAARAALNRALDSDRYGALLSRLGEMTAGQHGAEPDAGSSSRPTAAGPVVADRLRKVHRNMCRKGQRAATEEDWHDLRKFGKRLRYQVEGFRSLAPDPAAEALDVLRSLQTTLGEAQDRAAHAALLHEAGLELAGELMASDDRTGGADIARALLATGGLVEWHRRRGQVALDAAATSFARFDSRSSRRRFERLWEALATSSSPGDLADTGPIPARADRSDR